jgi:hypothetical protein
MKRAISGILLFTSATFASANSPMLVDSSGKAVGYFLGQTLCSGGDTVITSQGYVACIDTQTGFVGSWPPDLTSDVVIEPYILYESSDCSGTVWFSTGNSASFSGGEVIYAPNGGLYYLANMTSLTIVPASSGGPLVTCSPGVSTPIEAIPAQLNVAAITGISSVPYSPPFSIRVLPDSSLTDEIFFDQFDSEY